MAATQFTTTPTMAAFMKSKAHVRVLAGPIGGGKSVCCAHDLMRWACGQEPNGAGERKTRFLIVRNTADQLRSTTMKTVFDWFVPGEVGTWKATEKTLYIDLALDDGSRVLSEWMFIALDTPDDVRKALSLEATGLWGNESRELHPDVVDGLLMRVNRYPSGKDGGATRAGAIFDTNMPDDDSWWQDKMENPPRNWSIHIQPPAAMPVETFVQTFGEDPDPDLVALDKELDEWAICPTADNYKNLSRGTGEYYRETLEGKKKDFIRVYLQCKYGRSLGGFPVYEQTFVPDVHIASSPLKALNSQQYPLTIGLDFGRTPAAIIGQMDPRGRLLLLSEVLGQNMGIERFIDTLLLPHMYSRYPGLYHRVAPDPAGWQKTQVGEMSPADVLKARGFSLVKPHTNDPKLRIEAVERFLTRFIDGKPSLLVDPEGCPQLVKGFKTGYRWKMNRKGELEDNKPDKNEFSHPHDGLQYLCLVVDTTSGYARTGQRREVAPAPYTWV